MIEEQISLDVKRAPGDVFAWLADSANTPKWVKFCVSLQKIGDAPVGLGTRYHYQYKDGLRRGSMEGEVTELKPSERLAYIYRDKMLDVAVGFRFAPAGGGTHIEHWCKITPKNFLMRLMTPVIRSATKKQMVADTAVLKKLLEGAPL
jgi:uncharacterized protein YndB with AHSA1/START domain